MAELTDLLADPEPPARIAAARGLASTGREEAALLLRLRVLSGETSPEVLSECVTGMLRVDPKRSLPLAERLLAHEAWDVRDSVAFALGDWRHPSALPLLRTAFEREEEADVRRSILVSAGLVRAPEAVDWLVSVIGFAPPRDAAAAVDSLRVSHRRDATVAARVRSAVEARPLEPLKRALAEWQ
jgi:HEAT repeat protein